MDCSDDLFGGLPAVSKAQGGNAPTETGSTKAESAITAKVDQPESVNDGVENRSEKRKEGASLVSSLGTAGTAMVRSVGQHLNEVVLKSTLFLMVKNR